MIVALIDNGSLEAAAHRNLRTMAADLSHRCRVPVTAVSWKHSDRIPPSALGGEGAWTLAPWLRAQVESGEHDFLLVPFFISPMGAIGSALRRDLDALGRELGEIRVRFSPGLAVQGVIPRIAAARIRESISRHRLTRPPVIVVDHGGPAPTSGQVRDAITAQLAQDMAGEIGPIIATSMEGAEHPHNHPLFADALTMHGFDRGDVIVAPLFLAPGRHAGPRGDLAQIAIAAEDRLGTAALRCHFTELIGTHPDAIRALAETLTFTLSTLHVAA
jgi:sirohydrochlorin ferrochelatase